MNINELRMHCRMCKGFHKMIVVEILEAVQHVPPRVQVMCSNCQQVHYVVNE